MTTSTAVRPAESSLQASSSFHRTAADMRPPEQRRKEKRCTCCGLVLPSAKFPWKKNGLSAGGKCLACMNVRVRQYEKTEQGRRAKREQAARYASSGRRKDVMLRWRLSERGQQLERDWRESEAGKQCGFRANLKYRKSPKGRENHHRVEHRRRYRKTYNNLRATLTIAEWKDIKRTYKERCAYCGRIGQRLERDCVIPLSRGGNYTKDNVVPACQSCNSRKGNRWTKEKALMVIQCRGTPLFGELPNA